MQQNCSFELLPARHQWKFFRVFDALQIQIHVEIRPMKMIAVGKFHVEQLVDRRAAKPREIVEAEKILLARDEQPEAVRRTVFQNEVVAHDDYSTLRTEKSHVEKKVEKWHRPPACGVITFHRLEACATLKP